MAVIGKEVLIYPNKNPNKEIGYDYQRDKYTRDTKGHECISSYESHMLKKN